MEKPKLKLENLNIFRRQDNKGHIFMEIIGLEYYEDWGLLCFNSINELITRLKSFNCSDEIIKKVEVL